MSNGNAPRRPRTFLCLLLLILTACGGATTPTANPTPSIGVPTSATATAAAPTVPPTAMPATAPRPASVTPMRATPAARIAATPSAQLAATPPASGASCGGGVDLLGFSDALDGVRFADTDVGGLSALAYDAASGSFRSIVEIMRERPPARVYTLTLPITGAGIGTPTITGITLLRDTAGVPYSGRTSDNEGLALLPDGDLLVASETEPSIRRFAPDGTLRGTLSVPPRFLVAPRGEATNNLTFESLTLAPDGDALFTATEGPLRAEGFTADLRGRLRILRYGRAAGGDFAPTRAVRLSRRTGTGGVRPGCAEWDRSAGSRTGLHFRTR